MNLDEFTPIDTLASTATKAEQIKAANKLIAALNALVEAWQGEDPNAENIPGNADL